MFLSNLISIPLDIHAEDYDSEITEAENRAKNHAESANDLDSLLNQLKGEIDDTQSALNNFNNKIQENEAFLTQAVEELTKSQNEMQKLEIEIEELEVKMEKRIDQLEEQARKVQVNGNSTTYIDFVLNAESLTDVFARVDVVSKIVDTSKLMLEDQKKDKEAILLKTEEVNRKIIQQNALAEKLEETSSELESQKISQEALVLQLEIEQTSIASERAALVEQQNNALDRVKRLENDRELAQEAANEAQEKKKNEPTIQISSSKTEKAVSKTNKKEEKKVEEITSIETEIEKETNKEDKKNNDKPKEKIEKEEKVKEDIKKEEIKPSSSKNVLSVAGKYLATDYLYGGRSEQGFDCSGYTSYVFKEVGKSIPRTSYAQYAGSKKVENPVPGDLVFFGKGTVSHVGIYVGNNRFIGSQTSTGVAYARLDTGHWSERIIGYGRY